MLRMKKERRIHANAGLRVRSQHCGVLLAEAAFSLCTECLSDAR